MTLAEAKELQINVIYQNNDYLTLLNGFNFSGLNFGLSKENQGYWSNIKQLVDNFFPMTIKSTNGTDFDLTLINRADFYNAASSGVLYWIGTGNVLINDINAMTDIDTVLNFSDNRL